MKNWNAIELVPYMQLLLEANTLIEKEYTDSDFDFTMLNDDYRAINNIMTILSIKYNNRSNHYETTNRDGLLALNIFQKRNLKEQANIEAALLKIINDKTSVLDGYRKIRNKYQHAPHNIVVREYSNTDKEKVYNVFTNMNQKPERVTVRYRDLSYFLISIEAMIQELYVMYAREQMSAQCLFKELEKHN